MSTGDLRSTVMKHALSSPQPNLILHVGPVQLVTRCTCLLLAVPGTVFERDLGLSSAQADLIPHVRGEFDLLVAPACLQTFTLPPA